MSEAIYIATSGAIAQEMRLGMISNNLSNIDTTGYKEDYALFKSYSSEQESVISFLEWYDSRETLSAKQIVATWNEKQYGSYPGQVKAHVKHIASARALREAMAFKRANEEFSEETDSIITSIMSLKKWKSLYKKLKVE